MEIAVRRARVVDAFGEMVVDEPAAVGHDVRERAAGLHLALREYVRPEVAAAFALGGERARPDEREVFRLLAQRRIGAVLHPVPDAVDERQQLVAVRGGVPDRVARAAHFDPPVVVARHVRHAALEFRTVFRRGEIDRPWRRCVGLLRGELRRLQQQRRAHRPRIALRGRRFFAVFGARFASVAEIGARERREHRVAGAVGEKVRTHLDPRLRKPLPRAHGAQRGAALFRVADGCVEKERQARLVRHFSPQQRVEDRPRGRRVEAQVLEEELLHDARLAAVRTVRAADVHEHFARRVAPQHGTVLHEDGPRAVPRGGERGAEAGEAAAHDAQVGFEPPDGKCVHGAGKRRSRTRSSPRSAQGGARKRAAASAAGWPPSIA